MVVGRRSDAAAAAAAAVAAAVVAVVAVGVMARRKCRLCIGPRCQPRERYLQEVVAVDEHDLANAPPVVGRPHERHVRGALVLGAPRMRALGREQVGQRFGVDLGALDQRRHERFRHIRLVLKHGHGLSCRG